jgi:hypothetical protein
MGAAYDLRVTRISNGKSPATIYVPRSSSWSNRNGSLSTVTAEAVATSRSEGDAGRSV